MEGKTLNVAIIGARGIGRFHAREFHSAGCNLSAILGSSEESSKKTSEMLKKEFGIEARPYWDIEKMIKGEKLDVVSICTPPGLHYGFSRRALEGGINVFCEKPFVETTQEAEGLFSIAKERGKVISVNTQWPCVLGEFEEYVDLKDVRDLSISMESAGKGVEGLLTDHLSHANSILIRLVPEQNPENLSYQAEEDAVRINFDYGPCRVEYYFRFKEDRPRSIVFGINGRHFTRRIGEGYAQFFDYEGGSFQIEDPLKTSIKSFVGGLRKKESPPISEEEVLRNVRLQSSIFEAVKRGQNE